MTIKEFVQAIVSGYGYRNEGVEVPTGVPAQVSDHGFLKIEDRHETRDEWINRIFSWAKTVEGEACRFNLMERWATRKTEVEQERKIEKLVGSGVPKYLIQKMEEPTLDTGPLCAVREQGAKKLLVLAGGTGCGKTIAAIWLLVQTVTNRESALYCSAPQFARWDRYSNDEMGKLLSPDLLVIDDVGSEYNDDKGNFRSIFEEVVNSRCLAGKRTIVTANVSAETFKERYKDRIASRVAEFGAFFEFDGADMRRNQPTAG